jgi:hypothetical protein
MFIGRNKAEGWLCIRRMLADHQHHESENQTMLGATRYRGIKNAPSSLPGRESNEADNHSLLRRLEQQKKGEEGWKARLSQFKFSSRAMQHYEMDPI